MIEDDRTSRRAASPELLLYRLLGVVAILLIAVSGILHRVVDPQTVDPLWERALVMLACAVGVGSTWFARAHSRRIVPWLYYLVTAWVVHLVIVNQFSVDYALSLLVVIAAVSHAFTRLRQVHVYALYTFALLLLASLLVPQPEISRLLYLTDVFMILVLAHVQLMSRLRTRAELEASEERYALVVEGTNDGLWDFDRRTGAVLHSARWCAMAGLPAQERRARLDDWLQRVHPEDLQLVRSRLVGEFPPGEYDFTCEYRLLHESGEHRWMSCHGIAVRDQDGSVHRVVGAQSDITARKRAEEQLVHDAIHDSLTGLANRALFMDRLGRVMTYALRRNDYMYAVVLLDLDRFKLINDSFGLTVADQVLVAVSRRLEGLLRQGDTVARISGDVFAMLLDDVSDPTEVAHIAERLLRALEAPLQVGGTEIFISACMGIALAPRSGQAEPEELLRDADTALHRAKAAGRARYEIFYTEMHAAVVESLKLENDLRRALDRGEFVLYYQPIVEVATRELIGVEALVRWQHPERGLLMPDAFIAAAEETGLIVPLGEWVLREACARASRWTRERAERFSVSVNLSARQLSQSDFVDLIDRLILDYELPPDVLKLEITESTLMKDAETATRMLGALRLRGVQISIDDFGTGYSSLSYLHVLPADSLKIDRSFISPLGTGNGELVRVIIDLGRILEMQVIAEGVETPAQLEQLIRFGCDQVQGFLIARPMPPEQVGQWLAGVART